MNYSVLFLLALVAYAPLKSYSQDINLRQLEELGHLENDILILDGDIPPGKYIVSHDILIKSETSISMYNAEILFKHSQKPWIFNGLDIAGSAQLRNCAFSAVKGDEETQGEVSPIWRGISFPSNGSLVMENVNIGDTGFGSELEIIGGDALISHSNTGSVSVGNQFILGSPLKSPKVILENCRIKGVGLVQQADVHVVSSYIKPDTSYFMGRTFIAHLFITQFNGAADFRERNIWEGGIPTAWHVDRERRFVSGFDEIEKLGVLVKNYNETVIQKSGWGLIKKFFMPE